MKEKPCLKRRLSTLESLSPGVIVEAKSVVAAGLVDMIILVISFPQEFIIDTDGFPNLNE